jgi:hypothetical protein
MAIQCDTVYGIIVYDHSDHNMLVSQEKTRYEYGVALAASTEILKMPKLTNNPHWLVESEGLADKYYDVMETEEGMTCN